ncbi:hypothetical protein Tco_1113326 [Tanacetum coccineum]|uniref:Copia protein n=1 Tax=Tanacetum coccineum TaxID=301880 RepID=A0ABQ5IUV7_9ASTR
MKTPISTETKLTRDEEGKSVDNTKYRGMIGTTHLGLWYPKGSGIETIVYADLDQAGDYVDRKSTSGVCTFMGCFLTSWFLKKQPALAISTTEAEYVSAGKACQQALWMKQALVDYGIMLDDIPLMCDNKRAIDLMLLMHPPKHHHSIDYIPKSPTSSTSLSPNRYLNSPTSPPPNVSSPPPTQENASMDITLTLSPITPLDVQFDTPSPSPPIFGHLIPWNILEAHGDSCLCCIHNRTLIFGLRDELQYMFSYIEHMLSQPPTTIIPPPPPSSLN